MPTLTTVKSPHRTRVGRRCAAVGVASLIGSLLAPAGALAAPAVRAAGDADHAALIAALVRQDGSSVGVTATYLSRSTPSLAVVCQRTPDAGKVAYVFKRSGRRWTYVTNSRNGRPRSATQRVLEGAC